LEAIPVKTEKSLRVKRLSADLSEAAGWNRAAFGDMNLT